VSVVDEHVGEHFGELVERSIISETPTAPTSGHRPGNTTTTGGHPGPGHRTPAAAYPSVPAVAAVKVTLSPSSSRMMPAQAAAKVACPDTRGREARREGDAIAVGRQRSPGRVRRRTGVVGHVERGGRDGRRQRRDDYRRDDYHCQ